MVGRSDVMEQICTDLVASQVVLDPQKLVSGALAMMVFFILPLNSIVYLQHFMR